MSTHPRPHYAARGAHFSCIHHSPGTDALSLMHRGNLPPRRLEHPLCSANEWVYWVVFGDLTSRSINSLARAA